MNKPLTVRDLKRFCEQEIEQGNGNKVIMISDDDEGNGYHYLWYQFMMVDEYTEDYVDERIAPKNETIILG